MTLQFDQKANLQLVAKFEVPIVQIPARLLRLHVVMTDGFVEFGEAIVHVRLVDAIHPDAARVQPRAEHREPRDPPRTILVGKVAKGREGC